MFRTAKVCRFGAMALALSLPATTLAGSKSHPDYVRAMDDLRLARALLQRTDRVQAANDSQDEVSMTIANLEGAITAIDQQIGPELKKPHNLPRINPRMLWGDRLAESLLLLERAQWEWSKEKSTPGDAEWRTRVADLLDQAHTRLSVAVATVNFDYSARNVPTRND